MIIIIILQIQTTEGLRNNPMTKFQTGDCVQALFESTERSEIDW